METLTEVTTVPEVPVGWPWTPIMKYVTVHNAMSWTQCQLSIHHAQMTRQNLMIGEEECSGKRLLTLSMLDSQVIFVDIMFCCMKSAKVCTEKFSGRSSRSATSMARTWFCASFKQQLSKISVHILCQSAPFFVLRFLFASTLSFPSDSQVDNQTIGSGHALKHTVMGAACSGSMRVAPDPAAAALWVAPYFAAWNVDTFLVLVNPSSPRPQCPIFCTSFRGSPMAVSSWTPKSR
jgi:hypothetical protein